MNSISPLDDIQIGDTFLYVPTSTYLILKDINEMAFIETIPEKLGYYIFEWGFACHKTLILSELEGFMMRGELKNISAEDRKITREINQALNIKQDETNVNQ